jgi:HEAT repeat protein
VDPNIRHVAASAILKISPAAEAAVPALVETLDDKPLRFEVLLALEKMGQVIKLSPFWFLVLVSSSPNR